ncbi:VOC family protein [Streptomyces sp. NPDC005863]|uniref:VOC family protein n=1 Tax=unclassified Streptomyces TaxID=2593676 RepID=UPI0033DCF501
MPRDMSVGNERERTARREEAVPHAPTGGREVVRRPRALRRTFWKTRALRLVPPGERGPAAPAAADAPPPGGAGRALGAPCWLSLVTRDIRAAEEFYGRVLGWCHVPLLGSAGRARSLVLKGGEPVGTISETAGDLGGYASWMPYFLVHDVDTAVARLRERGATVAVGPLTTGAGRVAVVAGPEDAVFGVRQKAPDLRWSVGRAPTARLELHTRDIFAAALFYGGVLGWAGDPETSCDVEYVNDRIAVLDGPRRVAALRGGTAPGSGGRHRWHTSFRVADVDAAAAAALDRGGRVITPPYGPPSRREAVLCDREGIPFTVVAT